MYTHTNFCTSACVHLCAALTSHATYIRSDFFRLIKTLICLYELSFYSLTHKLTDMLFFYGSLSSTLKFLNFIGLVGNFMGPFRNLMEHVGNCIGQIKNPRGRLGTLYDKMEPLFDINLKLKTVIYKS